MKKIILHQKRNKKQNKLEETIKMCIQIKQPYYSLNLTVKGNINPQVMYRNNLFIEQSIPFNTKR